MSLVRREVVMAVALVAAVIWLRHDAVSDFLDDQEARDAAEQIETFKEIDNALSNLPTDRDAIREQLRGLAQ
jgi:hypothetical protein